MFHRMVVLKNHINGGLFHQPRLIITQLCTFNLLHLISFCDIISQHKETNLPEIYISFPEVLVLQFCYNMHAKIRRK